jgi:hypothetical protein
MMGSSLPVHKGQARTMKIANPPLTPLEQRGDACLPRPRSGPGPLGRGGFEPYVLSNIFPMRSKGGRENNQKRAVWDLPIGLRN